MTKPEQKAKRLAEEYVRRGMNRQEALKIAGRRIAAANGRSRPD